MQLIQVVQQNKTIHTRQQNGQQVNKSQIYNIYIHVNAFSSHHKNPILLIFKPTVHK